MSKVPLSSGELTQARRVANVEVALKEDMVLLSSLGKAADPAFEGQRWRLENTQCPLALSCVLGCIHMCCLDLLPLPLISPEFIALYSRHLQFWACFMFLEIMVHIRSIRRKRSISNSYRS